MIRDTSRLLSILLSVLFVAITVAVSGADEEHGDGPATEGLMRGERLFYGLIDDKFEERACADCHNTVEIDTFNWNPNAWEIAHKYK